MTCRTARRPAAAIEAVKARAAHGLKVDTAGRLRLTRTGRDAWQFRIPLQGGAYKLGCVYADAETGDALANISGTVYGAKYDQTRDETPTVIAARIRDQLRDACKQITGPLAGLSVSVRCTDYSRITVEVDGLSDAELYDDTDPNRRARSARYREVEAYVGAVACPYNYDGSDSMSDYYHVRFSLSVSLIDDDGRRWRQAEKDRKPRRKR